jgi:hypothetical protein
MMDVLETLDRRSKGTLDFLDYCVRAMQLDPLFVFLAQEYRINPTIPKAVALFHTFCAPVAPAKVSIEPDHERMQHLMRPITVSWTRMQAALVFGPGNAAPPIPPPPALFDSVTDKIMRAGMIGQLKQAYQARHDQPEDINRIQQHFVEKIWRPIIRPHLVAAGFWRIAELA